MGMNKHYTDLLIENKKLKEELEKYKSKDKVKRGDIIRLKEQLLDISGNIQSFERPYLVISNDTRKLSQQYLFVCSAYWSKKKIITTNTFQM